MLGNVQQGTMLAVVAVAALLGLSGCAHHGSGYAYHGGYYPHHSAYGHYGGHYRHHYY